MIQNIFRSIVLLMLMVLSYFVIMWVLAYLHTYFNGLFIPDKLRWKNGVLRKDLSWWLTAGMVIAIAEWAGLVWLSYRVNRWYGKEWPSSLEGWVVKLSTALVASSTGITLIAYYNRAIIIYF